MSVQADRFHIVKGVPPPPPTSALPLALELGEGGEVGKQPTLAPVSDFDGHHFVFFRKHLLGLRIHQKEVLTYITSRSEG